MAEPRNRRFVGKGIRLAGIIGLFFILGVGARFSDKYFEIAKSMDIFGRSYKEINKVYVDETDPTQLMRTAIDAMLVNMDPYTNYFGENEIEDAKFYQAGQYSGIGVKLVKKADTLLIRDIQEKGPADRVGLSIGDKLIQVGENSVIGMKASEAMELLNGESGSSVQVKVVSLEEATLESHSILREFESSRNVPYTALAAEHIGYIMLTGFDQDAGFEVYNACKKLQAEDPNLAGIILDLRGNPGGRVDEAVNITNAFLPKGENIVEMRGRTAETQRIWSTRQDPVDVDIPIAVLVNRSSASASEIVSGAIQDLDRGVVIGEKSFGKGLVQNIRPLSYNTQLKITIAKYYTPSGRCIQAIDYSSRNEDGSVGKIADSLKQAFTTRNGRTVYDGGGIEPDIKIPNMQYQPVTQALLNQGLIFDFASTFSRSRQVIASPTTFTVSDSLYKAFEAFVDSRNFYFDTDSDKVLDDWEVSLYDLDYQQEISEEIDQLRNKLQSLKKQDIQTHKKEIARVIRAEIIKRYYYQEGVWIASFTDDPVILDAVSVLQDEQTYQNILSDKG
ncbi:MAG: S41 family peptidase [Bacteroidota bacterium]